MVAPVTNNNSNNNTVIATIIIEMGNVLVVIRGNQVVDIVVAIIREIGFHHCKHRVIGRVADQPIEMVLVVVDMLFCPTCRVVMGHFQPISISRVAGTRIIITIVGGRVVESIEVGKTGDINHPKCLVLESA